MSQATSIQSLELVLSTEDIYFIKDSIYHPASKTKFIYMFLQMYNIYVYGFNETYMAVKESKNTPCGQ